MTAISGPGGQPVTTQTYTGQPVPGPGGPTGSPQNVGAPASAAEHEKARADKTNRQAAKAGDMPPAPPSTMPPNADWTQEALDKASAGIDSLEREIASLDLNSADGNKKMLLIQRKLQRLDEMIRLISTMWAMRHDAIKNSIGLILR
jgi:hypothetical protein